MPLRERHEDPRVDSMGHEAVKQLQECGALGVRIGQVEVSVAAERDVVDPSRAAHVKEVDHQGRSLQEIDRAVADLGRFPDSRQKHARGATREQLGVQTRNAVLRRERFSPSLSEGRAAGCGRLPRRKSDCASRGALGPL